MFLRAELESWSQGTGKENQVLTNGGRSKPNGGQSKMAIKNHNTEHRVKTHIDLAVLIRHSLKYKNTVSQKTSYRDTELQIQVLTE